MSQEHPVGQHQNPTSQLSVRLLHKPRGQEGIEKPLASLMSQYALPKIVQQG
jgi:hypothetical protein